MKHCLICFAQNPAEAATCSACGEGSFGAPSDAPPSGDAGKADGEKPAKASKAGKGKRGKGAPSDAPSSDDAGKADG
jgi:hypothetical protein